MNQKYKVFHGPKKVHSKVKVGNVTFGGRGFVVIAGPDSVEGEKQIFKMAKLAKKAGASMLRGGAFKPRTDPYTFRGLGEEALRWLSQAGKSVGLPVVTEVMDPRRVELVGSFVDMLQIGARNMHNFDLLDEVGRAKKPVLLKRGFAASPKEFLLAAEYILKEGNMDVVLCERGIRTFSEGLRFTPDLGIIPVIKGETHLPIIFDPSHSSGDRRFVAPLSKAALAVGADGIIVESHYDPDSSWVDRDQAISTKALAKLIVDLKALAKPLGRVMR